MTDARDLARDLEGLDPYVLMAAESERLDRFFATLDDSGWARPSRCAGWSVRDVLAHLTASEDYNRACLDGTVGAFMDGLAERGVTDFAAANEIGIRDLDAVPTPQLLEAWRTRSTEGREGFRARDGGDVDSSVGPYPARWQAFHLAFELAVHADDVAVPVTDDEAPGRLAWQARFARFALKEKKPDTRTEGRNGVTRVSAPDHDIELPDRAFVQAAAARVPDDDPLDAEPRAFLSVTP